MTAPAMDFETMFGKAEAKVNYDEVPANEKDYLEVPKEGDSLQVIANKMAAVAQVVQRGASVCVYTGFKRAAHQSMDAEATARMSFTEPECLQYDQWKGGMVMPVINWALAKEPVSSGKGAVKRFKLRAAAMNIIWKVDTMVPENAMWLTKRRTYMLPLVTAVTQVEAQKLNLVGGQEILSEMDMAEVQTIRKVVAAGIGRMNEIFAAMHKLSSAINAAKDTLQAREHSLKKDLPGYKPK